MRQGEHMRKNPLDILGLTNCDTETLIWLLTKINKLKYLGLCSSDLKSEDRSRNLSIKRIHGEKPIFRCFKFYGLKVTHEKKRI